VCRSWRRGLSGRCAAVELRIFEAWAQASDRRGEGQGVPAGPALRTVQHFAWSRRASGGLVPL
jgi:hypothetical protein